MALNTDEENANLLRVEKAKKYKGPFNQSQSCRPTKLETKEKQNWYGKCEKNCTPCPYVKEGKTISIDRKKTWQITKNVNCQSSNIIYLIECSKEHCKKRYIGETGRSLQNRIADHHGYIVNEHVHSHRSQF